MPVYTVLLKGGVKSSSLFLLLDSGGGGGSGSGALEGIVPFSAPLHKCSLQNKLRKKKKTKKKKLCLSVFCSQGVLCATSSFRQLQ